MRKALLAVLLLSIGIFAFIFFKLSQPTPLSVSEKNKAAEKLLGHQIRYPKSEKGIQAYHGKYFEISYPGYLEPLDRKDIQPKSVLETLILQEFDPRENVVMQVVSDQNSSIEDFSAVIFRTNNPDDYKKESETVDGVPAVKFTKDSQGVEIDAFVKKGDRAYSLVVSGPSQDESEKIYRAILSSFSLK